MKTEIYLSMVALVVMGVILASCENIEQNVDPFVEDNIVVCTTTVSLGTDGTKALAADGTKTFAVNDQIAVVYKQKTGGATRIAVSAKLTSSDITGGTSATFTVTLDDPDKDQNVTYIYPAAMANADGSVNYAALATQNGTLETLSSNLDLATYSGAWNAGTLPTGTLANQLAILAVTLKNADGSSEITSTITGMTLSDGTNNYAVSRSAAAGPIYVAIRPTDAAIITITATGGSKNYAKSLTSKTYAAGNGYSVSWKMNFPSALSGKFTINNKAKQVYFSKGNLQATATITAPGDTNWTWAFAEHQWDYIGGRTQSGSEALTGNNLIDGNGTLSAAGTVDLFGWVGASSEWTHVPTIYGISNEVEFNTQRTYGDGYNEYLKSDWGTLAITNGGNAENSGWRTLTIDEWTYLFETRAASTIHSTSQDYENARFVKAVVNDIKGVILFPDTYTHPDGVTAPILVNMKSHDYTNNNYSLDDWNKMESAGCVFLPAAGTGNKHYSSVDNAGKAGYYWCGGTSRSSSSAYGVVFYSSDLNLTDDYLYRSYAYSVRLVIDAN